MSSKESRKSKKSKPKRGSEPEKSEDETEQSYFKSMPSNFLPELINLQEEYQKVWKNKDESMNPMQEPYKDMIETDKIREIEDEVRIGVDQTLRGFLLLIFNFLYNITNYIF